LNHGFGHVTHRNLHKVGNCLQRRTPDLADELLISVCGPTAIDGRLVALHGSPSRLTAGLDDDGLGLEAHRLWNLEPGHLPERADIVRIDLRER